MGLARRTESKGSDVDVPLLDAGEYDGRLAYVADLGLQRAEYKGEFKGNIQQIALGIEIIGETIEVDDKDQPRIMWTNPFNIYETLTEKGTELKMYGVFDSSASKGEVPDWEDQLGKPCTVVVEQNTSDKDGKTYNNIKGLLAIPAKFQSAVDDMVLEPAIGDADNPNHVVNKALFGLTKFVYDKRVEVDPSADGAYDDDDGGDTDY